MVAGTVSLAPRAGSYNVLRYVDDAVDPFRVHPRRHVARPVIIRVTAGEQGNSGNVSAPEAGVG